MSLMVEMLRGQRIQDVLVDSEVMYIMLTNGTQVTISGLVVVEPKHSEERTPGSFTIADASTPHVARS